jgi:hypothetical protein
MARRYNWLAADSCFRNNRLDLAFAQYQRLLELDPTHAPLVWSSPQNVDQPERVYEKAPADNPYAEFRV